jgi:hypothetical protein
MIKKPSESGGFFVSSDCTTIEDLAHVPIYCFAAGFCVWVIQARNHLLAKKPLCPYHI